MLSSIFSLSQLIELEDASIYMPLDQAFVVEKARKYLSDDSECDLAMSDITTFQDTCKHFWVAAAKYAKTKLPLNSDYLAALLGFFPMFTSMEISAK